MERFFFSLLWIVITLRKTYESCGVQKITYFNLIDHEVSSGEFPWHVFLKPDSGHICSGTIIGEFWILSSAQCFTEMTSTILMEAGELNLAFEGTVYPIRKLIRHADYDENSSNNTLALLETSEPIMFNDMVLPACYPEDDLQDVDILDNCWVTIVKERTRDGSDNTAIVLKKIQFIPFQPCHFNNITDIICATASNVESSDCTVHSGDALMCQYASNKVWTVVGTAATEETECSTTVVFARTASYITWLKENTEMEGKPIIPEINHADLTQGTSKEKGLENFTTYYHEEFPSTENEENPAFGQTSNKESKLKAGKAIALSLFYTQTFLVIFST